MLNYGAEEWRRLPWWERRAYTNGMTWEFERGGLFPFPGFGGGKEGESAGQQTTYIPFTSMADRAREGITVLP